VPAPQFLTLDEVLVLHGDQIRRYGGRPGLRDLGLLQSALATPAATFGGGYLHPTLFEMAAAYLFHLARKDGNKRVALAAALVFLRLNGMRIRAEAEALYRIVMDVAQGRTGKAEVAVFLKEHAKKVRKRH
jgi:death-on-curing protein